MVTKRGAKHSHMSFPAPNACRTKTGSTNKALSLNLELQAALREQLESVDHALVDNHAKLKEAEKRLLGKRSIGIANSTGKFAWSRAVEKFLAVDGHPMGQDSRREQERALRSEPVAWYPQDRKLLRDEMKRRFPAAVAKETAVAALESVDWHAIAAGVKDASYSGRRQRVRGSRQKTAEECRLRWTLHDMPGIEDEDKPWDKEEDLAIMQEAEARNRREWVEIAEAVNRCNEGRRRRTPIACLRRFQWTLNTELVTWNKWSEEEERRLQEAIKRYGTNDWINVSRVVANRSAVQCYNRSRKAKNTPAKLEDPHACRPPEDQDVGDDNVRTPDGTATRRYNMEGRWTIAEQRRLCLVVRAVTPSRPGDHVSMVQGKRGSRAADETPRKRGRGRPRTDGAPSQGINWREVAELMGNTRTESQCREKWTQSMDPTLNHSRMWTAAEEDQLLRVVRARGQGVWVLVEEDMATWARESGVLRRGSQSCKRRFKALEPDMYEEHCKYEKDRRAFEPRRNVTGGRTRRTEITFDDYELSAGSEQENQDDSEECKGTDDEDSRELD